MTTTEIDQLKAGMAALEAQRALLGDAVVDAMLGPTREKLAALEAQSRADQQRKQATVLFADVSGFKAMSETLDTEDVAGVMNDLWAAVDKAITGQGAHIDKHIGDAVMALWGADTAREDDPEQALLLYGLVLAHPTVDYVMQVEINEEVAKLGLPAAEVEAGLADGAALDLGTVAEEILEGKWSCVDYWAPCSSSS